jgi:tetrahydromethanopterin S-methyltransferase subunit E
MLATQTEQQTTNVFIPTSDQKTILIIIGVYTAAILILWNMPIAKIALSPFKVNKEEDMKKKKKKKMTMNKQNVIFSY